MPSTITSSDRVGDQRSVFSLILAYEVAEETREVFANQLSVEIRLLHNIVSKIFFSQTKKFDFVTKRDLALIIHIVKSIPINLPSLQQMIEATNRPRAPLPYVMILSLLFKIHAVELEGEPPSNRYF